jgi:prevent-host-death family protein
MIDPLDVFGGKPVRISVSEAKAKLTALVHRAEAGDEVVLTRHGKPAVRLVPVRPPPHAKDRRAAIAAMQAAAEEKRTAGEDAARSQDYLYDADGLPR